MAYTQYGRHRLLCSQTKEEIEVDRGKYRMIRGGEKKGLEKG